ncbi:hypothetical protein vseg_014141 [Gypsophila vaccaria]
METSKTVERVKQLWEKWDIRAFMLLSLFIQISITFLAPYRKRSADSALALGMWLLYLSADAVALFTIGLISSTHDNLGIFTFWAPFLLLHLGGPDTITALALEDNELWHRHALQLMTQLSVSVYVFTQSFRQNHLWLPTILMFVDGLIKYVERTCALYLASADAFRESLCAEPEAGPNYARLMEEHFAATTSHIPTAIQGKDGEDTASSATEHELRDDDNNGIASFATDHVAETEEMVRDAYRFYNMFKGLIADAFLSLKDRKVSCDYFLNRLPLEAFRIIEIELNLVYDVFYTKAFLLERKHAFPRLVCLISVITSTVLFSLNDLGNYKAVDVIITYILLAGAIALDLCSIVKFVLSDWWYIMITGDCKHESLQLVLRWLPKPAKLMGLCSKNRWSHSISQYNLLRRFFKDPPPIINYIFVKRIRDAIINCLYVKTEKVDNQLIKLIVNELQMKSRLASEDSNAIKEVCAARGNLVLQDDYFLASEYLKPWTMDVDYNESLLIWHVATDICYFTSTKRSSTEEPDYRRLSKVMSDYMSYLLLRKATMVSPLVGMSNVRFEDTCEEAKKFTVDKRRNSWMEDIYDKVHHFLYECLLATQWDYKTSSQREQEYLEEFCKNLIEVKAQVRPMIAKGDKSKSVLFDACRLAQQLNMFGERQWEIISKVWVELLCYAAIRCSPTSHVAQLSRGGELITVVWQLMAHLGLGERFLQNQGFGWTKLIIQK